MVQKYNSEILDSLKSGLEKLKKEKKPGAAAGMMSKMELLGALKDEIKALIDDGYTPAQIADALTIGDHFSIIPKSVTQMLNKGTRRPARKARGKKATGETVEHEKDTSPAAASARVQQKGNEIESKNGFDTDSDEVYS